MRTRLSGAVAGALAAGLVATACGSPQSPSESAESVAPTMPTAPITLNLLDVGGVLNFTKPLVEDFAKQHPELVSKINYSVAPSTEGVSKIRAQQAAGRLDVDVVLSGSDAIGSGVSQGVWNPVLSAYPDKLPNTKRYTRVAQEAVEVAQRQAVVVATEITGPILLFNPEKVTDPPKTAQELLAWAQAHPKRFTYARPPASGPGRNFLMGLPYLLGDDAKDPENGWSKTWQYLAELDKAVAPYPSGTGESLKGVAQGAYDMVALTAGWDIQSRSQDVVPTSFEIQVMDNTTLIVGGHYLAAPKGLAADHLGVVLALMDFMLSPEEQVKMYAAQKKAIPGPAVEGVTVSDAPPEVQQLVQKYSRPSYDTLLTKTPTAPELPADKLSYALNRWDREIGS